MSARNENDLLDHSVQLPTNSGLLRIRALSLDAIEKKNLSENNRMQKALVT